MQKIIDKKICVICKIEKDISHFSKHSKRCKTCQSNYSKLHWKANKEKYKIIKKEYWLKNRDSLLAKQKLYRKQNLFYGFSCSARKLCKETGLSLEQLYDYYNKQFVKQNGCCAICGQHESEFCNRFSIDHDHRTNKLRGLLCNACNLGIGNLQDDAELCIKAYEYLRKY